MKKCIDQNTQIDLEATQLHRNDRIDNASLGQSRNHEATEVEALPLADRDCESAYNCNQTL